jgi:DNA primase
VADDIELIRQRADIVGLVSERIALKRSGKSWIGLCPFHDDKHPSFSVNPQTGTYRCWSCQERGDVFSWVMKTMNVDFHDALVYLAKLTGVELRRRGTVPQGQRERWAAAMESARDFFQSQLQKSSAALTYLENRHLPPEIIREWEIGYAPDVGEALIAHLRKAGHSLAECAKLSLIEGDERQGYVDRYRGRLIFPIRDTTGHLVGFAGRVLGQGVPKYINSSDSPLFSKRNLLYALHRARATIRESRTAILVEGYLDAIACHRAGITGAVASLGTALGEEHAKLLKRWCDRVVILYDADEAGLNAAQRATQVLQHEGLVVSIATLPAGKDPDALLQESGSAALQAVLESATSPIEFELSRLKASIGPESPEFWKQLVDLLSRAPNHLEAVKHLDAVAHLYPGIRDPLKVRQVLEAQIVAMRKTGRRRMVQRAVASLPVAHHPLDPAEWRLVMGLLDAATRDEAWQGLAREEILVTDTALALSRALRKAFGDRPPEVEAKVWVHRIEPPELVDLFLETPGLQWERMDPAAIREAIADLEQRHEQRRVMALCATTPDDDTLAEIHERFRRLGSG